MTAEIPDGSAAPAGWYPNPWNESEELYWSGSEWTGISRAIRRPGPARDNDGSAVPGHVSGVPGYASEVDESTVMRPVSYEAPTSSAPSAHEPPVYEPPVYEPPAYRPSLPPYPYDAAPSPAYPTPSAYPSPAPSAYAPAPAPASYSAPGSAATPAGEADAASIRWSFGEGRPDPSAANTAGGFRSRFGLIAMVVGIVAVVFAVIPGVSYASGIPALVAVGFGIAGFLRGRPRGFALAGIILGGAALAVGTAFTIGHIVQSAALAH